MKTFRNTAAKQIDHECTNILVCQAPAAPGPQWVECDESAVRGLSQLYVQAGVRYFGRM